MVEAFEVFDHENNKTVDVREVRGWTWPLGMYSLPDQVGTIVRSLGHCPSESQLQEVGGGVVDRTMDVREQVIGEMEDPEQMGYIHLDRFLPVMSRSA